ncbi:hypothetical protein [Pseudoalteromonas ruthenica]|nr:hypothetical protein [Pseudoalteromonas ruthenica]
MAGQRVHVLMCLVRHWPMMTAVQIGHQLYAIVALLECRASLLS